MRNVFAPLSKEEELKRDNNKKQIEVARSAAIKAAQECMADPKFIKCRLQLEELRAKACANMAEPINPDPVQDAYYLRSVVNTINVIDMILGNIEKSAKNAL